MEQLELHELYRFGHWSMIHGSNFLLGDVTILV